MIDGNKPDSELPRPEAAQAPRAAPAAPAPTAGSLLRAARESKGLHIAALAASMKVTQRKLEALEADRLEELPDATFARALAQSICRTLKVDPQPVLDLLPAVGVRNLVPASRVTPSPLRQATDRSHPKLGSRISPLFWAAIALVLAALAVFFLPADLFKSAPWAEEVRIEPALPAPVASPDAAASAADAAASGPATPGLVGADSAASSAQVAAPSSETVFSVPAAAGSDTTTGVKGSLVITTTDVSWVEVRDGNGQLLISETVAPGRTVGLDGALPFKLLVGNAAATRMTFMGRAVDLNSKARENVARFDLQ